MNGVATLLPFSVGSAVTVLDMAKTSFQPLQLARETMGWHRPHNQRRREQGFVRALLLCSAGRSHETAPGGGVTRDLQGDKEDGCTDHLVTVRGRGGPDACRSKSRDPLAMAMRIV